MLQHPDTADTSASESLELSYTFLLLTHIICADQQIHSQEIRALQGLATQVKVSPYTLQLAEKIFAQDKDCFCLEDLIRRVPTGQRIETLRHALAIAHIDGFFAPLEQEAINKIAKFWGVYDYELEQIVVASQRFALHHCNSQQQEVLLAGAEYDEAIQRCAKIAHEDYAYAEKALLQTTGALESLGDWIKQVLENIQQKVEGKGQRTNAKEVAEQLKETRQSLSTEISRKSETMREVLQAKQRSLNHFSIAFMGKTKAGKSTLHAVMTGEGWEAIGVGKQRTTRYNRVYEWKNIRIIDTPGIGAPDGKTDEEIARSVIEEADIICYVVTNDSISETEFSFLKVLKEKTKPLIILLNLQENLCDSRRLKYFLSNPDRLFTQDGASGIGGHIKRIKRYAQEHYPNDHLEIIPVMLLAAQLARQPGHEIYAEQLFDASRIQDFLDAIQVSLIKHGSIRRSQTLLGSTVGSINNPCQWIAKQAKDYNDLAIRLKGKREGLKTQFQKAEQDACNKLHQKIKEVFQAAFNAVPSFAEDHWEAKESQMESGWQKKLRSIEFEQRLKTASEEASQFFQNEVKEALEELDKELKLMAQLKGKRFSFFAQDTDDFGKQAIKFGGSILGVVCAVLIPFFPPFFPLLIAASLLFGLGSQLSNFFKSREQKRREAVQNISDSLKKQLQSQQKEMLQQAKVNLATHCQSISEVVDHYFEELIEGIEEMVKELEESQSKLASLENYLNRAYAKRIVDWATEQYEPLTDATIKKKIAKVNRIFGKEIQIVTTSNLPLKKSLDQMQKVLQENISVVPFRKGQRKKLILKTLPGKASKNGDYSPSFKK